MTVPDVRIERTLAAPPPTVYAAWTDPEILARWYCPNPDLPVEVTADLVVGGSYRVRMGPHVVEGAYTELTPPAVVAFTWRWSSMDGPSSQVRVELTPTDDGGTHLLLLLHTGLADAADAEGHAEGWDLSLTRLAALRDPTAGPLH